MHEERSSDKENSPAGETLQHCCCRSCSQLLPLKKVNLQNKIKMNNTLTRHLLATLKHKNFESVRALMTLGATKCFTKYQLPQQNSNVQQLATESSESDVENNKPASFFGSKAAVWENDDFATTNQLWYKSYVISGCLTIFLLYFCVLREENDIDRKFDKTLYDHVKGLEEQQLLICYKYNREHGLDVREIREKLVELGVDVSKL